MTEQHADHLLIGGGVASASCAKALRENGAEGSIALLTREFDPPYHRPPCTKEYLRGEQGKEDGFVEPASWYEEHGIDLRLRTGVRSIDTDAKTVKVQGGDEISYGSLLLATGSLVHRLRIDGDGLDGLHYIRVPGNVDEIREEAAEVDHVAVVGGSYIGCEVAASLTEMGKRVTLLMQEDQPMSTGFGADVGAHVRSLLEAHGITVLGGQEVSRFEGDGRVERVVTTGGQTVEAGVVVLGTGVQPDVMLARAAGLELGETGGVKCDEKLLASAADVYAAGDICEYDSAVHGRRLRVEHEAVAESQGAHAAEAMLGSVNAYTEVPYFWTDVSDWFSAEYVGPAASWDDEVVRGGFDDDFSVLYLDGGKLVACLSSGRGDDLAAATDIIAAGGDLPAAREALADADRPLAA